MSINANKTVKRRTWKVIGTIIKCEPKRALAVVSMFNAPQAIPLTGDSPRWLDRIGANFSTEVFDEDIRKGTFSGTFAKPLQREFLIDNADAACFVSKRFAGQFNIDFTSGGLEGHEYLKALLQRITKAIKADCLLGYKHQELENKLKARIKELWQLPEGEIILTSSGSEALFLAFSTSQNLAIQTPSFFGAYRTAKFLKTQTSNWTKVQDISANAEATYFCPTCNPATGDTLTPDERQQLANNQQVLIEDDPYFPLQFNQPPPHVFSLRNNPRDLYIGSFAKILGNGTRCGFIWTRDTATAKRLKSAKVTVNLGHSALLWKIILLAATRANLEAIINYNAGRKKIAEAVLKRPLPMNGGIFLILPCFENAKASAAHHGVTIEDLKHYYPENQHPNFCRINLLQTSPAMLREGLTRIKDYLYP